MIKPRHVAVPLVVVTALSFARGAETSQLAKKYAEAVRIMDWAWSEDEATILHCLAQPFAPYDLVVIKPKGQTAPPAILQFKIMDGQRQVYAWSGQVTSAFILEGERLYYVQDTNDGFSALVAVNLKAGKELWKSRFRDTRPATPGRYWTRGMLRSNGETVSLFTKTSAGRFFELKDAETGDTIGFKAFDQPTRKRLAP